MLYRITDPKLIEDYFSDWAEEDRPWNEWKNDPHNEFNGSVDDLTLLIEYSSDDQYTAWILDDCYPSDQPGTPDDFRGVTDWLEKHKILT